MKSALAAVLAATSINALAAIAVVDDAGRTVTLARPAQRVISMRAASAERGFL